MNETRLFNALIVLAAGVIVYVIVVGGVVCVRDDAYVFAEYLTDLANVAPYLFGAIAAVVLRGIVVDRKNGRNGG